MSAFSSRAHDPLTPPEDNSGTMRIAPIPGPATVTELPLRLEAVEPDPFIVDLPRGPRAPRVCAGTGRMTPARTLAGSLCAIVLMAAAPAAARGTEPPAEGAVSASVAHYRGLAAWIDVYDPGPWERPAATVRGLARRAVTTVFVQTSNHRHRAAVHEPGRLARLLAAAHARGMRVIGWYLPGFADPRRDWRRVRAAITLKTAGGHRFDGFALDIEATAVRDTTVRNRRMLRLSRRLRRLAGERYALGAIIPDPVTQRYWARFPYAQVRALYDVMLPMAYWTAHRRGPAAVFRHTRGALRLIRSRTGDRAVPVHVIGGIAGHATAAEVGAFVRAARQARAIGASLYDAPITSRAQWDGLSPLTGLTSPRNPTGSR